MSRPVKKLLQRLALVFAVVAAIAIGFVMENGYWWPTSDVFVLPGGLVWAGRMFYEDRIRDKRREENRIWADQKEVM